jgi:hypothetical protein
MDLRMLNLGYWQQRFLDRIFSQQQVIQKYIPTSVIYTQYMIIL